MIVVCKMVECSYHGENGYCEKPEVICIDQMGMCNTVWKRGMRRQIKASGDCSREKIEIADADFKEFIAEKEEAETRLEDPPNGDPA